MIDLFKKMRVKVLPNDYLIKQELKKLENEEQHFNTMRGVSPNGTVVTQFAMQKSIERQVRIAELRNKL